MIAWFARNDVAANLLMITVLIGGAFALSYETAIEIFPSSEPEIIRVSVPLRGATPEDAELGLAVRIEEAVDGLDGIKRISSVSVEGSARVDIEVEDNSDPRVVLDEVKTRIDAINTFPAEAEKPVISLAQRKFGVITVVVAGRYSEREIRSFAENVRDDLSRMQGISQVSLDAVRKYEIAIEASQDRLREYGLSLAQLATAIRSSSVDLSAGNVRTEGGDVLIRSKGQAYRRSDFESIVVKTNSNGSIIRVGDVAVVKDGFEEDAIKTRFDGDFAALIQVERVGDESALEISELVRNYIEEQQVNLPVGMKLKYWDDDAQQLKNRLGVLGNSAFQGAFLVIGLLALFLRPAIAIWVFVGIPISFLGAFMLMSLFGITLNLMSAFGFIVVLGIVVDDAIVTGESVYQRIKSGDSGLDASINGTMDVAVPVTFGVLTTMVAFLPLTLIEGRFGTIMGPVAAVVISVLFFSLIESKLVLPAHLKKLGKGFDSENPGRISRWQSNFADGFECRILTYYRPALSFLLTHRFATLASFLGVLFLMFALIMSGWTKFTFMPRIQGETATASLTMPVGTQFKITDRYIDRMFVAAQQLQEKYIDPVTEVSIVKHVMSSTGSQRGSRGSEFGRVQFELVPPEQRNIEISTNQLIAEWRKLIGPIPGAESITFRANFFRVGDPIDIQLSANSFETLEQASNEVRAHLQSYPTVYEIADSLSDGKEELRIDVKPQGHVLGLTRNEILGQVSQAFQGFQAQRIQRGRDDIRVLVRLPVDERSDFSTLGEMLVRTPTGREVPLAHVATLSPGKGPQRITRIDRYRTVNITAEVEKTKTNMTVLQEEIRTYMDQLISRSPGLAYEMEGEAREQRESFGSLQSGLVLVLFAIYCMLALPLKSYTQPLLVMSVIPFSIIGAIVGHWIMGYTLSMMSVMGLLALTGVVVNDSLVLVHQVNKLRDAGQSALESVLNAGVVRFRPIILTSLTTFFGLAPLLVEKSTTAQFLIPMGISLGFGILFATLITLILIPVNMLVAHDIKLLFSPDESASLVS
ncbi:MAG: multidrug efflux pump subunit AcrB [Candidatus Azotimanducaceae bacterium]|jgi:multidrug efflux pump subunit AcrB